MTLIIHAQTLALVSVYLQIYSPPSAIVLVMSLYMQNLPSQTPLPSLEI